MTATALHADVPTPMRDRPASIATLSTVELRKATDTRAGRWLLIVLALIALGGLAIGVFAVPSQNRTYATMSQIVFNLVGLILPVVGILLVTSEWSQRSALTTFSLVPRRSRVLVAKLVAGLVLAVAGWLVAFGLAVLGTALASRPAGLLPGAAVWGLSVHSVLQGLLYLVLAMFGGMAFGLLFLNSAAAIVVNFVLPTVWTIVSSLVPGLRDVQPWLDPARTWGRLLDADLPGRGWAQVLTTAAVWILLPGAVGAYRMLTREVS